MTLKLAHRPDPLAVLCGVAAVGSILASVFNANEILRAPLVIAAVVLGPGVVLWRWLTPRPWLECVAVGAAVNVALLMLLGLFLVSIQSWHPVAAWQVLPIVTCLICYRLLFRATTTAPEDSP